MLAISNRQGRIEALHGKAKNRVWSAVPCIDFNCISRWSLWPTSEGFRFQMPTCPDLNTVI